MKALVHKVYGTAEVLELGDVALPELTEDRVIIEVRAGSLNAADRHFMTGTPWLVRLQGGIRKPKRQVVGLDVAGVIREVGANVEGFAPGDEV